MIVGKKEPTFLQTEKYAYVAIKSWKCFTLISPLRNPVHFHDWRKPDVNDSSQNKSPLRVHEKQNRLKKSSLLFFYTSLKA